MSKPEIAMAPPDALEGLLGGIESFLDEVMTLSPGVPATLRGAARYALQGPSKRIRPMVLHLLAAGTTPQRVALHAAAAVELVHTASLILDDLPCMDDAALRRSRPATHRAYGEATAILTAIAFLNRAFGLIAESGAPAEQRLRLVSMLERAVGWDGLVAGQELDVAGTLPEGAGIEHVNWLKTGTLFVAAAGMGAVIRGVSPAAEEKVEQFARELGLAFQLCDDLLDRLATAAETGKDAAQDTGKSNVVSLLGIEQTRAACLDHLKRADAALVASGIEPEAIRALVARAFRSVQPQGGQ
jgi:geranylgeranyl diphosphate synthase type II